MARSLSGLHVLVTGASSGIGATLAQRLATEGAIVALCARRADRLDEVLTRCREHQPACERYVVDLEQPEQVDALAAWSLGEFGGVDVLVNNAGIPKRRLVTALDQATVERVMRVNFLSATQLTLALLPQLVERRGEIVDISSVAAVLSSPGEAAYDASKAALSVWSEAMAVDLWDTGVRIHVVYPGIVDTELFEIPDNDVLDSGIEPIPASDIADAVLAMLGTDQVQVFVPDYFAEIATGKASNVQGFVEGAAAWVRDRRT